MTYLEFNLLSGFHDSGTRCLTFIISEIAVFQWSEYAMYYASSNGVGAFCPGKAMILSLVPPIDEIGIQENK